MRESGYVQMARLSGASTGHIMFREMLPNLVPYLFGSFIANVTTSIVTAVGLEVLQPLDPPEDELHLEGGAVAEGVSVPVLLDLLKVEVGAPFEGSHGQLLHGHFILQ